MQSTDTRSSTAPSSSKALWGAGIGIILLVILFVVAIFQAAHEESVLGWIVAAILLAWVGVAAYLCTAVVRTLNANRRSYEMAAKARIEDEDSMLADKLEHSFQIVLVQSKVIKEQLEAGGDDAQGMIERALDTINTTSLNGMGMVKEELKG